VLDSRLPHLEKILDPETVLRKFREIFNSHIAKKKLTPEACAIERIQHKKGKRCRVLYRMAISNENGRRTDQWFSGKLVKPGQARQQYELARASEILVNGEWPAVTLWDEWDFILWSFPNDPGMPNLRIAADMDYARSTISENMVKFGYSLDWHCEKVAFDRVKYMPGKRCVLRMNAWLRNRQGKAQKLTFFSKTYPDRNGLAHYRVLNQVYNQFNEIVNIPPPVLYLEEANSFWQEQWPGRPLVDVFFGMNWDGLFTRLGKLVAAFHKNQGDGLRRKFDAGTVLFAAEEDAKMLGWLLPQHRLRTEAIAAILNRTRDVLQSTDVPVVPIHGALRIEQFVSREGEVALLDFDATSLGDPLFDVVELITSLQYMELTRGFAREKIDRAVQHFEQSYFRETPWQREPKRMAWYAVAFLLTKMYDSVKNIDRRALESLDRAVDIQQQWLDILVDG
jgi:hypothetical protein